MRFLLKRGGVWGVRQPLFLIDFHREDPVTKSDVFNPNLGLFVRGDPVNSVVAQEGRQAYRGLVVVTGRQSPWKIVWFLLMFKVKRFLEIP